MLKRDRLPLPIIGSARKVWDDLNYAPSLLVGEVKDGKLLGFAMGVIRDTSQGRIGYTKLLTVVPEARRQGIGKALVQQLESAMQAQGAEKGRVGESAPNYLLPGLDVRYTHAWLLFQNLGYKRFGETYNLDVDLHCEAWDTSDMEVKLAAQGVTVRRARATDTDLITNFLDAEWPSWKAEVYTAMSREPLALHVAVRGEEMLGFSAYDANNMGTGWFGPMGNAPAARGLGIGGVLLRRCLRDQKTQGHTTSIIPWVGPIGFYAHFAKAVVSRVFYRLEKPFS